MICDTFLSLKAVPIRRDSTVLITPDGGPLIDISAANAFDDFSRVNHNVHCVSLGWIGAIAPFLLLNDIAREKYNI